MVMVQFSYKDNEDLARVLIICARSKRNVNFNISDKVGKDTIHVFIKSVVFHHVDISWLIQSEDKLILMLMKHVLIGVNMFLGKIQQSVAVCMAMFLMFFL